MTGEYEEKKAAYENLAAGLESNMSKLEQVIEIHTHTVTHPSLKFKDEPFFPSIHTCARARCCGSTRCHFLAQSSCLTCLILCRFQEVRGLREELTHEEGRYHYLHCMLKVTLV